MKASANVKSFVAAFSSFAAILGVIATSSSTINLVIDVFQIDLSELFSRYLAAYREIVAFFFWPLSKLGLDMPQWGRDLIVMWLMLSGSVFRTYYMIKRHILDEEPGHHFIDRENNPLAFFIDRNPAWRVLLICIAAWPYVLFRLFDEPLVWWNLIRPGEWNPYGGKIYMRGDGGKYREKVRTGDTWDLVFDSRKVFAFQLAAVFLAVLVFVLLNGQATADDVRDIVNIAL